MPRNSVSRFSVSTPSFRQRAAGILLHPTSLPGPHGCGDLGPAAHDFIDFLADAGVRWWQMLPVNPPDPTGSPYSAYSAFAGSPLLVSLDVLAADGLLSRRDLAAPSALASAARVPFAACTRFRLERLRRAHEAFLQGGGERSAAFRAFAQRNAAWLDDYALFAALHAAHGGQSWQRWPEQVRSRQPRALERVCEELAHEIAFHTFVQYAFECQWRALRERCARAAVGLIGDIPIFVGYESADVWRHQRLFTLRPDGSLELQSGVPPDGFSRTGQLWRHPLYHWRRHARDGYGWWIDRFRHTFTQFDAVRIDHFLGFAQYWAVPGRDRIALHGRYVKGPGAGFFAALQRALGPVEIIAEDLGAVTPEATALREQFGFPGMRILHWAFGRGAGARYNQPHNFPQDCVAYTGTHDNNTTMGWWRELQRERPGGRSGRARGRAGTSGARGGGAGEWDVVSSAARARRYLGTDGREIHWDMIRALLASPANTAVVPLQDVLGLDRRARMNLPATERGNWAWRFRSTDLRPGHAQRLREMNEAYERVRAAPGKR